MGGSPTPHPPPIRRGFPAPRHPNLAVGGGGGQLRPRAAERRAAVRRVRRLGGRRLPPAVGQPLGVEPGVEGEVAVQEERDAGADRGLRIRGDKGIGNIVGTIVGSRAQR